MSSQCLELKSLKRSETCTLNGNGYSYCSIFAISERTLITALGLMLSQLSTNRATFTQMSQKGSTWSILLLRFHLTHIELFPTSIGITAFLLLKESC